MKVKRMPPSPEMWSNTNIFLTRWRRLEHIAIHLHFASPFQLYAVYGGRFGRGRFILFSIASSNFLSICV